ncbi:MAG: carboxypeptidase regulatory-like domain-containing protein, partial [Planctomycetes bacterium]|nr:carboxypeptidase regulatory-like domain-containing protein [Planctomycetota bacterium]
MKSPTKHLILICLAWLCSPGLYTGAATLTGKVTDPSSGKAIRRITVRAFAHGRSVAVESMTENDGSFVFGEIPAGSYAVCAAAGQMYRPICIPHVDIKENEDAELNIHARNTIAIEGDSWTKGYASFAQSFQATGLGVTAVRIKAFGPKRKVAAQIVDGDGPDGRAIGPARITEAVGGEGSTSIAWSGAEAPTIPGKTYTIKLSAMPGQEWIPALAGRGDVYAGGSAWFGTEPRPFSDLGIAVCEDNDDLRTSYAVKGAWRMHRARSAGQTFTALGRNVIFASAQLQPVSASPTYVRFSIHEDAPGGKQLGPSKAVAPSSGAAVAWGPDEVPVRPGKTYYLHIESFTGANFLTACQPASFTGGSAFFNGSPAPDKDIAAVVTGQITESDFARLVACRQSKETLAMVNPSFENGMKGWKRDGAGGDVVGCDGGFVPMWQDNMFGWTNRRTGEDSRTVIYQTIKVA